MLKCSRLDKQASSCNVRAEQDSSHSASSTCNTCLLAMHGCQAG